MKSQDLKKKKKNYTKRENTKHRKNKEKKKRICDGCSRAYRLRRVKRENDGWHSSVKEVSRVGAEMNLRTGFFHFKLIFTISHFHFWIEAVANVSHFLVLPFYLCYLFFIEDPSRSRLDKILFLPLKFTKYSFFVLKLLKCSSFVLQL